MLITGGLMLNIIDEKYFLARQKMGLDLLDPSINITISSEVDNNNESTNFNNFSFDSTCQHTLFDLISSTNE